MSPSNTGRTWAQNLLMGLWLGALSAAFAIPGFWWLRDSVQEFEDGIYIRWALFMLVISSLMLWVAAHGFYIAINVMLGKTSPRLARRDFRNILSNVAMGAKTGMWKE